MLEFTIYCKKHKKSPQLYNLEVYISLISTQDVVEH